MLNSNPNTVDLNVSDADKMLSIVNSRRAPASNGKFTTTDKSGFTFSAVGARSVLNVVPQNSQTLICSRDMSTGKHTPVVFEAPAIDVKGVVIHGDDGCCYALSVEAGSLSIYRTDSAGKKDLITRLGLP
jgi:hypothetical protein